MLFYGKARLRLDRVLLVLGLSYVAVAGVAYQVRETPDQGNSELISKVSDLEDRCATLQRSLRLERARDPGKADYCLPDSPGSATDPTGFPLPTETFSLFQIVPKPREGSGLSNAMIARLTFTRTVGEESDEDLCYLADDVKLSFMFGGDGRISFGALMKSWENALGHTVIVPEFLAQSMVKIETEQCPELSWRRFKNFMSKHGIGFLEQHVGKNVFVITAYKK